jgi:hypothetical protein
VTARPSAIPGLLLLADSDGALHLARHLRDTGAVPEHPAYLLVG